VLLGTLVSQTALNILALTLLGAIIVASTDLFHSSSTRLFVFSAAPLLVLLLACRTPPSPTAPPPVRCSSARPRCPASWPWA
jgi:phosphatidylinositol alpha-mannosyltransferase